MPIPEKKETIIRSTAKERVYKSLQQWIVDGTLLPGERLNDQKLAEYFSVSRTPVREALQMLVEQKLVNVVPSSGTFVAPIDKEDMTYVYQLLIHLQFVAISLCIHRISRQDLALMENLNESFLISAKNDVQAAILADSQFHMQLAKCSGNPYLASFTENLLVKTSRNENQYFKNNRTPQESYQSHQRIINALQNGDEISAQEEIILCFS